MLVGFLLDTNMGAIETARRAGFPGLPTPFTALGILWINIIMDGQP